MLQVTAQTEKQPGICSAHPRLNIVYTFLLKITYSLEAKLFRYVKISRANLTPKLINISEEVPKSGKIISWQIPD
jgi:hypothetical protein